MISMVCKTGLAKRSELAWPVVYRWDEIRQAGGNLLFKIALPAYRGISY